jgi:hypothetical protein
MPRNAASTQSATHPSPKVSTVLPPSCLIEPIEQIRFLFVDEFQKVRIDNGEKPAQRAVFRKQHGVANAKLSVLDSCPAAWRAGLWSGGPYAAWIRWSSDTPAVDTPDQQNNTLGFAIKLFGVKGPTLATDNPLATNADLIFQNSDIFFVDNVKDMCAISADSDGFLAQNRKAALILQEMQKPESSALAANYSSTLPYAMGNLIAKFRLLADPKPTVGSPGAGPNYLADDLMQRLKAGPAGFVVEAQLFVDDSVTPVDRATVRWESSISPFVPIARIDIPQQDINAPGQSAYGEALAFSPWRTLHENRPLGSIADARRIAYPASAALRRSVNGQSLEEPAQPR